LQKLIIANLFLQKNGLNQISGAAPAPAPHYTTPNLFKEIGMTIMVI
jgi:hypothetical protein